MTASVTAVIPAHLPRLTDGSLRRAVDSVLSQQHPADAVVVAVDATHDGAAATRQRALQMARSDWVAFLDSDDWWYPHHLSTLLDLAREHDADYCYSWFSGNDPFPMHRGRQMNAADPHHTTMTVMVRTGLAKAVGFVNHPDANKVWPGEDWNFTLQCVQANARFAGSGDITWHYGVDGRNTSGLPTRWEGGGPQADVTVVIPHIPTRRDMLLRALDSVTAQTVAPAAVSVAVDNHRCGSADTRNRALSAASTGWVAFLDDDDELGPQHIELLAGHAEASGADVVYSGCTVLDAHGRPVPPQEEWGRFGLPFDPDLLRRYSWLPVTSLVRTELARQVGGFTRPPGSPYDDWGFYLRLLEAGARFVHLPVRTWTWHHWGHGTAGVPGNTSGDPTRW